MVILLETSAQKKNEMIFLSWQLGKWVYMEFNISAATVVYSVTSKDLVIKSTYNAAKIS
jgi:hypothetical protein